MDWRRLIEKLEKKQEDRKKELKEKTEAFKNTWKNLKTYEKILVVGLIVVGIGMVIKGCVAICA